MRVQEGIIGIKGKTRKNVTDENYQENPIVSVYKPRAEEPANLEEDLSEEQLLSPIDPLFMASAEQTIFSSIGGLRNLLGQSSTFDRIAEETIASTVSSLEDILRQANCSYLELSSCPSDSGVSVGEEASGPSRVFNFNNITHLANPPQEKDCRTGSLDGQSPSGVGQPEWLSTNEKSDARCYLGRGMFVCSNWLVKCMCLVFCRHIAFCIISKSSLLFGGGGAFMLISFPHRTKSLSVFWAL